MATPSERPNLRKVQPFLLPHKLAADLEETARQMTSPMMPRVSLAAAARDLIAQGLAALDVLLRSGKAIDWLAADPPRGARRREAETLKTAERVRDNTFVQVSPLALSEEIIASLEDLRRRLSTATGLKVSTVKVLRESLARGLDARTRTHTGVEALLQKYASEFKRAGIFSPAQLTVVSTGVTQKYVQPVGGADVWGRAPRASATKRKGTASPKKVPPKATTTSRARARSTRQKTALRRESSDDEGDGEPAPPPRREPRGLEAPCSPTTAPPTPVRDADRGSCDRSLDDPPWRAKARAALARLLLAAIGRP